MINRFKDDTMQCTNSLRNKGFMLEEMFQRNTSKFAIYLEYENSCSFFHSSFYVTLFSPNECPDLCRHRPGRLLGEKIK